MATNHVKASRLRQLHKRLKNDQDLLQTYDKITKEQTTSNSKHLQEKIAADAKRNQIVDNPESVQACDKKSNDNDLETSKV